MGKYEAISLIGEGSFGTVYKGKVLETNEIVALKIIVKRGRDAKELKNLKRECEIQRTLNHPNIIQMLDSFETDDSIVVISEYVDRELSQLLRQEGRFSEPRVHQITCDLVSALFYLHSHRVLHRDLKPQNVLIDNNGVAKLCDFGFARSMGARTHVLTSFKGTPLYMAPEVINAKPYDYSADLWSLGCIIYELLVGTPPFCTTSLLQLAQLIQYEKVQWPEFISPDCKSFLHGLLQKEPDKRFLWSEIREHPYLKGGNLIFETDDPDFKIKYPFTNELSASQAEAKEIQRKEILEEAVNFYANRQVPFYVPSVMPNLQVRPKEQPLVLMDADRVNATKPSSCPSQSVSVFKSLTENPIFKKVLHSSLKRVNKSLDLPNEKLYTSLASDFEDLNVDDKENRSNENSVNLDDEKKTVNDDKVEEKETGEKVNKTKGFKTSKTMFTLHSWDSAASVRPIENDEWLAFLQRNMEELITGQLDCLRNHNLVSVVVAPLRNSNASSRVLEYVAKMLSLPFVVEGPSERDLENIKQVYLEIKLIPNLVYASKIVARNKGYNSEESNPSVPIDSEMLLRPVSELSSDELQALESIYVLLCYLVIQRRDDFGEPKENFNRDWNDYKIGFGDPAKEFWLGNENIYMLTNNEDYVLRIELEDFEGNKRYAQYSHFKIYSEAEYYKLEIDGYEGNAGDSLNDPWYGSNNSPFSTYNRDNDRSSLNCASMLKGGWWWKSCGRGLNGLYLTDPQDIAARQGIVWFRWRGWDYTLKKATMMIRPKGIFNTT